MNKIKEKAKETEVSASEVEKKPGELGVIEAKGKEHLEKGCYWVATQGKTEEVTTGFDNMKIISTLDKQCLNVVAGICFIICH